MSIVSIHFTIDFTIFFYNQTHESIHLIVDLGGGAVRFGCDESKTTQNQL